MKSLAKNTSCLLTVQTGKAVYQSRQNISARIIERLCVFGDLDEGGGLPHLQCGCASAFKNHLFIEAFDGPIRNRRINNVRTAPQTGLLNAAGQDHVQRVPTVSWDEISTECTEGVHAIKSRSCIIPHRHMRAL